eukprot:7302073-Alexandrium_andersonii.AAC.1
MPGPPRHPAPASAAPPPPPAARPRPDSPAPSPPPVARPRPARRVRQEHDEQDPSYFEFELEWDEEAGRIRRDSEVHVRLLRLDGTELERAPFAVDGMRAVRVLFLSAGQIRGGAELNQARAAQKGPVLSHGWFSLSPRFSVRWVSGSSC